LEGNPNSKVAVLQIYVLPVEPERFALSQAHRQRKRVQSFEPVTVGRVEQNPGIGWAYGPNFRTLHTRRVDQSRNIHLDQPPFHGLSERRSQNGV